MHQSTSTKAIFTPKEEYIAGCSIGQYQRHQFTDLPTRQKLPYRRLR